MDIGLPLDVLFSVAGSLLAVLAVGVAVWLALVSQRRAQIALADSKRNLEVRADRLESSGVEQASLDAAIRAVADALVESGADEATVEIGDMKITMTNKSGARQVHVETSDDGTEPLSVGEPPTPPRGARRSD